MFYIFYIKALLFLLHSYFFFFEQKRSFAQNPILVLHRGTGVRTGLTMLPLELICVGLFLQDLYIR